MFRHSSNTASFLSALFAGLVHLLFLSGISAAQSNTSFGTGALASNTTGSANTAIGVSALFSNITGSNNTASGVQALVFNSTGGNNTATGLNALFSNTTGSNNTAAGVDALFSNSTGNDNTASGVEALFSNTTGSFNTADGFNALFNNTTGFSNTATGFDALLSTTTGAGNTGTGVEALVFNTTGGANTASGDSALFNNTTGSDNTGIGLEALFSNTTGNFNTAIGVLADVSAGNLNNATAIGAQAVVNASNKIRLGNSNVTVIEGQVAFTASSDRTKKENFKSMDGEHVLRKIRGFELTSWNFIGHDPKEFRHYGPMAQDFFAAFGHDGVGNIGSDTTINSGDIAGILMIAVQALEKRTTELKQTKAKLAGLAAQVQQLKTKQAYFETVATRLEALERENQSMQAIRKVSRGALDVAGDGEAKYRIDNSR
jgi:hypothetical protein